MTTMKVTESLAKRIAGFLYGIVAYCLFLGTFLYLIGFVGNLLVPKSVDTGEPGNTGVALVVNALLLTLFSLQHSIMARPGFKRLWTRVVPVPLERSTFVLLTCVVLALLYGFWQPLPQVIWSVGNETVRMVIYGLFALGWAVVLISTFLINHFDLFGLRQVYLYLLGKPYTHQRFRTTAFYTDVRHPLMAGFLIAFWATPDMTLGHLLLAGLLTLYILAAIQLEERDLESHHGEIYRAYKRRVPMLLPLRGASGRGLSLDPETSLNPFPTKE
jgi:protein-S-isoprenylcysteine O-methyltransferase Ste14